MAKSVEVDHISKRYKLGKFNAGTLRESLTGLFSKEQQSAEFWALQDISFSLNEGDSLGIIGKNGAGKSTLLKILSKITQPTSGEVRLYGRVSSLLEVGTGFHPELTGRENIYLNGSILGMKRREIKEKFDEIVDFSGIDKFLDTPVKRYSSGMYVRLAFAVAAHLEPEILIVDEVLAVGDHDFQKKCLGKMDDVVASGKTIIFVSHNLTAVESLCNRAIFLENGRLIHDGATHETIDKYMHVQGRKAEELSLAERTDRQGKGTVKMTALELLVNGASTGKLMRSGESLTFKLSLHFGQQTARDISIAIGISTVKGQKLCDLWSKSNSLVIDPNQQACTVECTIPRLPFNQGEYNYSLCVKSGTQIEDFIIYAGTFKVEQAAIFGEGLIPDGNQGPILIEQSWK